MSGLPVDKKCTLQPYSKRLKNYTKAPDLCFLLQLLIRCQMFLRMGHMAALHCSRPHPHPMWNFGLASQVITRKHEIPGSTLRLVPRVTIVFKSMLHTLSCGITITAEAPITDSLKKFYARFEEIEGDRIFFPCREIEIMMTFRNS